MDLTKVKLHADPGCTYGGIPIFLLVKGQTKILLTSPVLHNKKPKLYQRIQEAPSLPMGKGITIMPGSIRVFRVHPNQLSEKQREKMVGPGEGGKYRAEFVEDGLTDKERRHRAQEVTALAHADVTREEKAQRQSSRNKERGFNPNATLAVKDIAQRAQSQCEGFWPNYVYQFLREKGIGKRGGRYLFTNSEAEKITRAFINWYWEEEEE